MSEALLPLVPSGITVISESGIGSSEEVARLVAAGARGFLIGESLMLAADPRQLVRELKAVAALRS